MSLSFICLLIDYLIIKNLNKRKIMRTIYLTIVGLLFLMGGSLSVSAQVSNDNEDGVYKVDKRYANDFVPGQVLVKFMDASPVVELARRTIS